MREKRREREIERKKEKERTPASSILLRVSKRYTFRRREGRSKLFGNEARAFLDGRVPATQQINLRIEWQSA